MISTTLSNKTRITQETGAKWEDSEGLEVSTVLVTPVVLSIQCHSLFNKIAELISHYMFILSGNYSVLIKADDLSFILHKKKKKKKKNAICEGICY
jgi:hypothetical protein